MADDKDGVIRSEDLIAKDAYKALEDLNKSIEETIKLTDKLSAENVKMSKSADYKGVSDGYREIISLEKKLGAERKKQKDLSSKLSGLEASAKEQDITLYKAYLKLMKDAYATKIRDAKSANKQMVADEQAAMNEKTKIAKAQAAKEQKIISDNASYGMKIRGNYIKWMNQQTITSRKDISNINALEKALKAEGNSVEELTRNIKILERARESVNKDTVDSEKKVARLNKALKANKDALKKGNSFISTFTSKLNRLKTASLGVAGAVIQMIKQLYQLGKGIGSIILTFDRINYSMKTIIRDSYDLVAAYGFVGDIVKDFGLNLESTTKQYLKFNTAAKQAGLRANDTQQVFKSVAKASAVMGLSVEDTEGVFLALEQMLSKGKVSSEELRKQLGNRLPGAVGIMADALGVTTAELEKMLKKGEILAVDVLPAFAEQLEKQYDIEAIEEVDTLMSSITRLETTWKGFVTTLISSKGKLAKFFQWFTDNLNKQYEALTRLAEDNAQLQERTARENSALQLKSINAEVEDAVELELKKTDAYKAQQSLLEHLDRASRKVIETNKTGGKAEIDAKNELKAVQEALAKRNKEVKDEEKELSEEIVANTKRRLVEEQKYYLAREENFGKVETEGKKYTESQKQALNRDRTIHLQYERLQEQKLAQIKANQIEEEKGAIAAYKFKQNTAVLQNAFSEDEAETIERNYALRRGNIEGELAFIKTYLDEGHKAVVDTEEKNGGARKRSYQFTEKLLSGQLEKEKKYLEVRMAMHLKASQNEELTEEQRMDHRRKAHAAELELLSKENEAANVKQEEWTKREKGRFDKKLQKAKDAGAEEFSYYDEHNKRITVSTNKAAEEGKKYKDKLDDDLQAHKDKNDADYAKKKLDSTKKLTQDVFNIWVDSFEDRKEMELSIDAEKAADSLEAITNSYANETSRWKQIFTNHYRDREDDERVSIERNLNLRIKANEQELDVYEKIKKLKLTDNSTTKELEEAEKLLSSVGLSLEDAKNGKIDELIPEGHVEKLRAALKKLNIELDELAISDIEDWKQKLNEAIGTVLDFSAVAGDIMDGFHERRMQQIELEHRALQKGFEQSAEAAEGNAERQKEIAKEKEKMEERMAKKKLAEERKNAKREKAQAIFELALKTAIAIMAGYAHSNVAGAIIAGVLGAAQMAAVIAQPLPAYKDGRIGGDAEYALLNDGGEQEVVTKKGKAYLPQGKNSVHWLDSGDSVYPSIDAYNETIHRDIYETYKGNGKGSNTNLDKSNIEDAITKGFKKASIKNTINTSVSLDHELWIMQQKNF